MDEKASYNLPNVRRIVTYHNARGMAVVEKDHEIISQDQPLGGSDSRDAVFWVHGDGIPTNDNNKNEDGRLRLIDNASNFNLIHPNGTNFKSGELGPGASTVLHRTSSLDYNILVQGELILIMEDGSETHLRNPGDHVIVKGTLHAWKNPSTTEWTRWMTVLVAAEPALVHGNPLPPIAITGGAGLNNLSFDA